jgi:hypothetical protein
MVSVQADYVDGFRLSKELGSGLSCKVRLGEKDNQLFAIKLYQTSSQLDSERLM